MFSGDFVAAVESDELNLENKTSIDCALLYDICFNNNDNVTVLSIQEYRVVNPDHNTDLLS